MYAIQAATPPDTHSLHITVSANQKNTWGDFMEKVCVQIPVWPATQMLLVAYSSGSTKSHCWKCTIQRRPTSWVSRLHWDCELRYCESVLDRGHELPAVCVYVHPSCRMMREELNFLPRFLTSCHSWLTMLPLMQLRTRCWHEYTVKWTDSLCMLLWLCGRWVPPMSMTACHLA